MALGQGPRYHDPRARQIDASESLDGQRSRLSAQRQCATRRRTASRAIALAMRRRHLARRGRNGSRCPAGASRCCASRGCRWPPLRPQHRARPSPRRCSGWSIPPAADLAPRPAARGSRLRRRGGSPPPTTSPPGGFMGQDVHAGRGRGAARAARSRRWRSCSAGGVDFVATMADADDYAGAGRRGGRPGADPERAGPRRPAARRRLPRQHAAPRAEPGDADRRARAVPRWKRWSDWLLIEGSHPDDTALGRRLPRAGDEVRREHRRDPGLRGYRRRAAHRFGPRAGPGADAGLHPARARA